MKKLLAITAAATLVAGATAQSIDTPVNLALRIGYAYPIDNATRDIANGLIGIGAEYFLDRSLLASGETTLSFDWLGKSSSGSKGNIFPILLNQRWYGPQAGEDARRTYAYLGAGIAIVDVTSTKTVLAARAGYGVELGEHLFGEGTLLFSDDANGARATSLGLYIGYRF